MSTFNLTFNEDISFSVVIYTLPSIYSLHSLLDRSPKWLIPELFYFSYMFLKFPSYLPCLYIVTAHYDLSLWFSNFHVHINHLEILVKINILIQCCVLAPETPHCYQEIPVLLVCCPYFMQEGLRQHSRRYRYKNICWKHTGSVVSQCGHLPPPLTSYMTLRNLTYLFENPLSPLQNKDSCLHVSDFLQWLSVVFSLHTP